MKRGLDAFAKSVGPCQPVLSAGQNFLLSLTFSQTSPVFYMSAIQTLWEKEKLLVTSSVFYPFEELSAIFVKMKIVICKLFQFGKVQNLSFGKGLNFLYINGLFSVMDQSFVSHEGFYGPIIR